MISRSIDRATAAQIIEAVLGLCGEGSELVAAHEREWASATFSGARHSLDLLLPLAAHSAPFPPVIARLPEHDFELSGEIVADCAVTIGQRSRTADGRMTLAIRVELLTIVAD